MDRDLIVKVGSVAGYSSCDRPVSITWQNEALAVSEVLREWREPGAKHYLVAVSDGRQFKLVFFETTGQWNIIEASTTKKS